MSQTYRVNWAYYGSCPNENTDKKNNVTAQLQALLPKDSNGVIKINNANFGPDPSPGNTKAFCASVNVNGSESIFIAVENQTIDFS
jgi:hypothetical protein